MHTAPFWCTQGSGGYEPLCTRGKPLHRFQLWLKLFTCGRFGTATIWISTRPPATGRRSTHTTHTAVIVTASRGDQSLPRISLPLSTCVSPMSGCDPVIIPFTTSKSTTGPGVWFTM